LAIGLESPELLLNSPLNLTHLFQSAKERLIARQEELNQADTYNGNHGDHMVEIFEVAVQAAGQASIESLSGGMQRAGEMLSELSDNGSAQVYAQGLTEFSQAFARHEISLEELVAYVRGLLRQEQPPAQESSVAGDAAETTQASSAQVLKALVDGLYGWRQTGSERDSSRKDLDMGALFELGMIYMQAKRRGGSRLEVISEAAVSASPLSQVPHRYLSGKLAISALLEAMVAGAPKDQQS
jgi:hypothetical protein